MRCTKNEEAGQLQVNLGGEVLEEVGSFRYLGSHVTRNGEIEGEIKYRVGEAGKVMGGMKKIWKNGSRDENQERALRECNSTNSTVCGRNLGYENGRQTAPRCTRDEMPQEYVRSDAMGQTEKRGSAQAHRSTPRALK